MNIRTLSMFSVVIVIVMLLFVGGLLWNHSNRMVGDVQPSMTQASAYPISLSQASIIAQDTAPHASIIGTPMITSYQGISAYVVPLDAGTIYVEATTGRVLANKVAVAVGGYVHE